MSKSVVKVRRLLNFVLYGYKVYKILGVRFRKRIWVSFRFIINRLIFF